MGVFAAGLLLCSEWILTRSSGGPAAAGDPNDFGVAMLAGAGGLTMLFGACLFGGIAWLLFALYRKVKRAGVLGWVEWTFIGVTDVFALLLVSALVRVGL